jgi:membrane protease YdiL (CAAX protease family)
MLVQLFAFPIIADPSYGISPYYTYIYIIFSYLAISAVILLEINNLNEFHIDRISLWLFIITCFVRSRLGVNNEIIYLLPLMLIGLANFFQVVRHPSSIPRTNGKTILHGAVLAGITIVVITVIESFQASNWLNPIYSNNVVVNLFRQLIFQLSFIVLIEEIVFRGFLTAYLIKIGVKEKTAFTIQALLYWLVHYNRSDNLISFYISIPILAWSTSFIVKRHKQLTASIIVHTTVNVFMGLLINIWF